VERSSTAVEAAYFGFITGAPDGVVDGARERLERGRASDAVVSTAYTAVDGLHQTGEARNSRASVILPDRDWTDCEEVIRQVRTGFHTGRDFLERRLFVAPDARGTVPSTFLHAVVLAIEARTRHFDCPFVYNARQYHLFAEKAHDEHAARLLAAKGLTTRPENVVRIQGQVCEQNRSSSSFRLWIEEGAEPPLPLRIEFQPRPYLRVSLEYDPAPEVGNQRAVGEFHKAGNQPDEET